MNKRNSLAIIAMTALGLTVGGLIVLPGPPTRADTTPPAYVTARTRLVRIELEAAVGGGWFCQALCRGTFADGGGAKRLRLPVGGGYLSNATIAGCVTSLDALCDTDAIANAPAE